MSWAISVMSTLLSRFCDSHLAVVAVEMKCESLTVVEKEKRSGILCLVMAGTDSELISDAVAGAHEFCIMLMSDFVCRFDITCTCGAV